MQTDTQSLHTCVKTAVKRNDCTYATEKLTASLGLYVSFVLKTSNT